MWCLLLYFNVARLQCLDIFSNIILETYVGTFLDDIYIWISKQIASIIRWGSSNQLKL